MSLECHIVPYDEGLVYVLMDKMQAMDAFYASGDGAYDIGAIHMAKLDRVVKGLGGCFVDLGGVRAFLRTKKMPAKGRVFPVQIQQYASKDKVLRVSDAVDYRGLFQVLTPGRPGANLSRKMTGDEALEALTAKLGARLPEDCGMILRTEAAYATQEDVEGEFENLLACFERAQKQTEAGLIAPAMTGEKRAELEWGAVKIVKEDQLSDQLLEALSQKLQNPLRLAGGTARVERTQALIAVDVDTGANTSQTAARDVNLALAKELPRWLHMRGWAGQIVIDLAPMPVNARKPFEAAIAKSGREVGLGFTPRGFGPLGLFEAVVRYSRHEFPEGLIE